MSVDPQDVRTLARAFARHLEHLQRYRAVHYVGADAMPVHEPEHEQVHEPGAAEPEVAASAYVVTPEVAVVASEVGGGYSAAASITDVANPATPQPASKPASGENASEWSAGKKLEYLRDRNVGNCQRCPLAKTRRNIVFGVGDPDAELMFVGEAPGADEDRLGEPFVGAAGKRLDQWITQLGLRREQVYIANVLKCRPPSNRDPRPEEIERCSPFLHAQIRAIEPKVLVALGRFAGCLLIGGEHKLWEMRRPGQVYREPKSGAAIPLVVTYHPSYVIRSEQNPREERGAPGKTDREGGIKSEDQKVMDDLRRALSLLQART